MKVVTKERTKVEKYNVYVANDGQEFNDENECEKYEESAEGVINAMLRKIMVKDASEEDILGFGSCDCTYEVYLPKTEDDKKTIMQMLFAKNPHLKNNTDDFYRNLVTRSESLVDRAVKESDYLVVSRGYEYDGFWIAGTLHSMQEQLAFFCEPKKQENV